MKKLLVLSHIFCAAQSAVLALKFSGWLAWPWLMVLAPILGLMGLGATGALLAWLFLSDGHGRYIGG